MVSVGGDTNDVIGKIDELHGRDFDFLLLEINKIATDSSFLAETNPESEK